MNCYDKNFIIVRYWHGSGGKFLSSYLWNILQIPPVINLKNVKYHGENMMHYYGWHNLGDLLNFRVLQDKIILINEYELEKLYNKDFFDLIDNIKKNFIVYPPKQKNFCYISETHSFLVEEIYGWIDNLKIINITFEEDDFYEITSKFVKKVHRFRRTPLEEIQKLKKVNINGIITEEKLIDAIYEDDLLVFKRVEKYLNYVPQATPMLNISFKELFGGGLKNKERMDEICNFMGIELNPEVFSKSIEIYEKYLNNQSLIN